MISNISIHSRCPYFSHEANTALTREGDYSEYLAKFNFLISVKFQISFLIPFISSAFCAIKLSPKKKGDYYLYYARFP